MAYALALTRFRGRKTLLVITLVTMIMPQTTLVLPVFLELNRFHLIGTIWSVILPFSFYPFGVYLVYIYFGSSLPRDLLSAARIDGCTEWQLFSRIALPLAKPVVGLVAFFSFVGNWNNFFLPYLVLPNSEQFPVQVGLNQLLTSTPSFNPVMRRRTECHHPRTRPGHHHRHPARAGALRLLPAHSGVRDARRSEQGMNAAAPPSLFTHPLSAKETVCTGSIRATPPPRRPSSTRDGRQWPPNSRTAPRWWPSTVPRPSTGPSSAIASHTS